MKRAAFFLAFLFSTSLYSANTIVGIYCQENTKGVEVFLNGDFKLVCEDYHREALILEQGEYEVKAVLSIDKEREKVFIEEISTTPDRPTRVKVFLGEEVLTAYGVEMAQKRKEVLAQKLASEKQAKEKAAFELDLKNAEAGDLTAMKSLAQRYQEGKGVAKDATQASLWEDQYRAHKTEADRAAKIARLEKKLEDNQYFGIVGTVLEGIQYFVTEEPSLGNLSTATAGTTFLPVYTIADIISSPTVYSARKEIKKELEGMEIHAVHWANPESMVVKASK